ncbi:hypothetical protein BDA99DRAFT_541105 [Phascolomyces articulosus]|uniref:Uncharacterized protein n=1 Tax=Phascolomyces articulosus TaxID=60185 RepID=A0AAD5JT59_9FUNG|nr:hypothetical protein BDA99DRAFT_541105 [Phascolomyces articulosus]
MLCSMSEASDSCQILRLRDWIVIVGVALMIIVILFALLGISVLIFTRRSSYSRISSSSTCVYCKDPERQPLLHYHHRRHHDQHAKNNNHTSYPEMKRTPTFYQWNKLPYSQQNDLSSSSSKTRSSSGEYCWHQRREALLKRYTAA